MAQELVASGRRAPVVFAGLLLLSYYAGPARYSVDYYLEKKISGWWRLAEMRRPVPAEAPAQAEIPAPASPVPPPAPPAGGAATDGKAGKLLTK